MRCHQAAEVTVFNCYCQNKVLFRSRINQHNAQTFTTALFIYAGENLSIVLVISTTSDNARYEH
jgi:hypothetical protein